MENESLKTKLEKISSIASGVAIAATGSAIFTTSLPALTGVIVGTAIIGSGISYYTHYKARELDSSQKNTKDKGA